MRFKQTISWKEIKRLVKENKCIRCKCEIEDDRTMSIYGFCVDCHNEFIPKLRKLRDTFIIRNR